VAVRRVVIDVRAGLRRVQAWFRRLSRRDQDQTISRLQATRQRLQAQWAARTAGTVASTRYDGADRVACPSSLVARDANDRADPKISSSQEEKKPEKAVAPEGASHIDRLLAAKRRKTGQDEHDHLDNR
jgi:hypothetical protein